MNLILRAFDFALAAHGQQRRKYTDELYIFHPWEVYLILLRNGISDPEMLAAAMLHDTVEDTDATLDEIAVLFGVRVAQLVGDLTDISHPLDGNRAARKLLDRRHTAQACGDAQTIKCADLISNTRSIVTHDPGFARVYLPEKLATLMVMPRSNIELWWLAGETLNAAERILERSKP